MAIAMVPGKRKRVCLPEDEAQDKDGKFLVPESERTYFHIVTLTHKERLEFEGRWAKYVQDYFDTSKKAEDEGKESFSFAIDPDFVKATLGEPGKPKGLVGWENFKDEDGNEVAFAAATFLEALSGMAKLFLAIQVWSRQFLSETDKKN